MMGACLYVEGQLQYGRKGMQPWDIKYGLPAVQQDVRAAHWG